MVRISVIHFLFTGLNRGLSQVVGAPSGCVLFQENCLT